MKASDVISLLAQKHAADVFVRECKDGPTQSTGGRHLRLDAWAMSRSWSKPMTFGYEVKVSRSDFLNDMKWPAYLDLCSNFYFACPHGLIQPDELPAEVGLLWVAKTGTRLFTKRKAVYREVQIPESLFRYILMSRAAITDHDQVGGTERGMRAYWERWLEKREIDRSFGFMVGKTLRERIEEEIMKARRENAHLERRLNDYEDIRTLLRDLGLDPERPGDWAVRRTVREVAQGISPQLKASLGKALDELAVFRRLLEDLEKAA